MNKSLIALAALAVLSLGAHADGLTANVSLTSKYKYRGQDQSDPETGVLPAIQGGFDYAVGSLYVGNWNSSVGFGNGTEMDFYGGYKGEFAGVGYDVGGLTYYYAGTGASAFNTTELYGSVSYSFFSLKYSHTISSKYFGIGGGKNTGYFDLSANYEFAKGWTANGHVGLTTFSSDAKDIGAKNYTDFKLGATYDFGNGLTASGAWIGADEDKAWGTINKDRFLVSVTKAF